MNRKFCMFFQNYSAYTTEQLREELLMIKGVGYETADVMLLYIFERKVFVSDTYAQRLFKKTGLGTYESYEEMRKAMMPIPAHIPYELCREWHAAIDMYEKDYQNGRN